MSKMHSTVHIRGRYVQYGYCLRGGAGLQSGCTRRSPCVFSAHSFSSSPSPRAAGLTTIRRRTHGSSTTWSGWPSSWFVSWRTAGVSRAFRKARACSSRVTPTRLPTSSSLRLTVERTASSSTGCSSRTLSSMVRGPSPTTGALRRYELRVERSGRRVLHRRLNPSMTTTGGAMYDVDMRVDIVDWNHYAVEGVVDEVQGVVCTAVGLTSIGARPQSIDDDDMGCRGGLERLTASPASNSSTWRRIYRGKLSNRNSATGTPSGVVRWLMFFDTAPLVLADDDHAQSDRDPGGVRVVPQPNRWPFPSVRSRDLCDTPLEQLHGPMAGDGRDPGPEWGVSGVQSASSGPSRAWS